MPILGFAYLAAFVLLFLLLWMARDVLLPKKQEFEQNEWASLDLLRQELNGMEAAINRHLELVEGARQNFTNTECEMAREIYIKTTAELKQLNYDRNIFVDKGITRPGQCCYDIYLKLSRADVPLGFSGMPLSDEFQKKMGLVIATDAKGIAMMPVDEQSVELRVLANKFAKAKARLLKRLDIYKK